MTDLNNEANQLNDAELEVVVGGMDCKTGQALGDFYYGLADCMAAIGNYTLAFKYSGMGQGVKAGACG